MVFVSLGVALVLFSSKLHGSCSVMGLLLLVSLCWVFLLYSVFVWVFLLVLKVFFSFFAMFTVCFKLSLFFSFFLFLRNISNSLFLLINYSLVYVKKIIWFTLSCVRAHTYIWSVWYCHNSKFTVDNCSGPCQNNGLSSSDFYPVTVNNLIVRHQFGGLAQISAWPPLIAMKDYYF